jgi:kynurenine formamidase
MASMRMMDLTHPIRKGMTIFPGDPQPVVTLAEEVMAPWKVSALQLGTHTGTHIDAAAHYVLQGKTIDQYPLERFILAGVVADARGLHPDEPISDQRVASALTHLPKGGAFIIRTYWDRYWDTPSYLDHPYLSAQAARIIQEAGASLVGIDALNVDSTPQGCSDVHEILLGSDILIVENLTGLAQLKVHFPYKFSFLPLNLYQADGSPIRAIAWEIAMSDSG